MSDLNDLREAVLESEATPQANLVQAILAAEVEEPPELEAGLSALSVGDAPPERDPADEQRLAQLRQALAESQGPQHTRFTYGVCAALLGAGFAQGYAAMIARSGWLLLAAAASLTVAWLAWRKSHWLQFNLRTALVATVLVSLPMGWLSSMVRQYWREDAAAKLLMAQWSGSCNRTQDHLPTWFQMHCPDSWLPVFSHMDRVTIRHRDFGDEQMAILENFSSLEIVDVSHSQVTNAGLEHLAGQRRLHSLYLRGTKVTRGALEVFDRFPVLTRVDALATAISRADAREFENRRPDVRVAARRDDEVVRRRQWKPAAPEFDPADMDEEIEQAVEERIDAAARKESTRGKREREAFEIELEPVGDPE